MVATFENLSTVNSENQLNIYTSVDFSEYLVLCFIYAMVIYTIWPHFPFLACLLILCHKVSVPMKLHFFPLPRIHFSHCSSPLLLSPHLWGSHLVQAEREAHDPCLASHDPLPTLPLRDTCGWLTDWLHAIIPWDFPPSLGKTWFLSSWTILNLDDIGLEFLAARLPTA